MLGLEFAPINIPLKRRLETLAVLYYCLQFLFFGFWCTLLFIFLLFTRFYWISLLYTLWFIYDRNACEEGGRRWHFIRRLAAWKHFADFFPAKLVKTTDLSPKKNYIFGCHPHGIMCFSHFVNFATEGTNFSTIFPNIYPHLITLNFQFWLPIHREIVLSSGTCAASRESINYILSRKGTGNAAAIIIGGALEVLDAHPKQITLVIRKRKGFVRLAIKNGASLVPVMSFGENELFNTLNPDDRWNRLQEKVIKILSFPIPIFFGRGIFQYSFGLIPFRKPIVTVVGKPMDIKRNENPTEEEVNEWHQRYIDALVELFETNKVKYNYADVTLKIK